MPRIPDQLLNTIVYLYPNMDAARAGEAAGGTGFLVAVLSEVKPKEGYVYAVTNAHVARAAPILRMMRLDGAAEPFPLTPQDWIYHAEGDDVAVYHVDL